MDSLPIYLDNHSTTRVDPRVVEAMHPFWDQWYGNAGSTSHVFGRRAKQAVDEARELVAHSIGAQPDEIVFTSGATESNNLALRGVLLRRASKGKHVVSLRSEHRAVLDPLRRLGREGFEVTLLPVLPQSSGDECGRVDLNDFHDALRGETQLASVMAANNEIGVLQPLLEIADACHQQGVLLHTDATQAVGKIPFDVGQVPVDLVSFTAHKLHGPKGIGALCVRRTSPPIRLTAQIDGGGQESGRRSGTLPVPLIVGFARAIEIAVGEREQEMIRQATLRDRLWEGLRSGISECRLNGPPLERTEGLAESAGWRRLPNNLNVQFSGLDGEALMMKTPDVAVSSGSACSAANPEPSHVLSALGLDADQIRSSLRFGLSRFTTEEEIERAVLALAAGARALRDLQS